MAENQQTRVKICGIMTIADARHAAAAGADFLGYILYPKSPRYIAPPHVRDITDVIRVEFPHVEHVGVFVNVPADGVRQTMEIADLDFAQLHGTEPSDYCADLKSRGLKHIKVFHFGGTAPSQKRADFPSAEYYLCDTHDERIVGGTGRAFDRSLLPDDLPKNRIILAGGLTPENIADAVREIQPFAVDVSTGVEISPGRKDHAKVQLFISNAKAALSRSQ